MKYIALNGSPRKHHNSDLMLDKWIEGVRSADPNAEVTKVNLYDLSYTGCRSCFACKRIGGKFYGTCPVRDGIHDVLAAIREADAVAISTPDYFMDVNAYTKCLIERMLFPAMTYSGAILTDKAVDFTMIYTMNATEQTAAQYGILDRMTHEEGMIAMMYKKPVNRVVAYNTYQFDDYNLYEHGMFSVEDKRRQHDEQFPRDLQSSFDTGARVAKSLA